MNHLPTPGSVHLKRPDFPYMRFFFFGGGAYIYIYMCMYTRSIGTGERSKTFQWRSWRAANPIEKARTSFAKWRQSRYLKLTFFSRLPLFTTLFPVKPQLILAPVLPRLLMFLPHRTGIFFQRGASLVTKWNKPPSALACKHRIRP